MFAPCPPFGGIMTSKTGDVVPVGTFPVTKSTVPKVYPEPPLEIVIDSIFELLFTTIVASAPDPSPFIGTLVYVVFAVPIPTPRFVIVTIFNCPLVAALFLTAESSSLVSQFFGTGIKLEVSNLTISLGVIVYRYFQIYPSPLVPADLGSKSVKVGSSRDGLPSGFSVCGKSLTFIARTLPCLLSSNYFSCRKIL